MLANPLHEIEQAEHQRLRRPPGSSKPWLSGANPGSMLERLIQAIGEVEHLSSRRGCAAAADRLQSDDPGGQGRRRAVAQTTDVC